MIEPPMQAAGTVQPSTAPALPQTGRRTSLGRRAIRLGCLALLLTLCTTLVALGAALQSGSAQVKIPGGTVLKLGSDDFVLSNYSFQTGTTYFFDINGNGVRNILQLHYLADNRTLQLVVHYASRDSQGEHHLLSLPVP
jgi:hypothetical protein